MEMYDLLNSYSANKEFQFLESFAIAQQPSEGTSPVTPGLAPGSSDLWEPLLMLSWRAKIPTISKPYQTLAIIQEIRKFILT